MSNVFKNIDKLEDNKYEIDLVSLNDFLFSKGDEFLNRLIFEENNFISKEEINEFNFDRIHYKLFAKDIYKKTDFNFVGNDFPVEYFTEDIIFSMKNYYGLTSILLININSGVKGYFDICKEVVEDNYFNIELVNKNIENYYSLLKIAFEKNPYLIRYKWFPKEYIPQLRKDFPNTKDLLYQNIMNMYSDNNLQENNSLLKEENFNEESFVFTSDRHKIDIKSLSDFLLEKGDRVLDTLLYARGYKEIDYYSDFFREEIIKYVNSDIIKKIPKELWDDYSFCLTVSSRNAYYAIDFINEDFLNDYNIVKNLLTQQGELINKVNPDILDEKLIRLANKTNTSGKDLTDTCYFWEHYDGRYELLKKIISVYPDKIRYIHANEYKYALDNKYYELFKIAYLKNKNIMRYNKLIKHWSYYERLKKEIGNNSLLKEYISKEVRKLLKEKISL